MFQVIQVRLMKYSSDWRLHRLVKHDRNRNSFYRTLTFLHPDVLVQEFRRLHLFKLVGARMKAGKKQLSLLFNFIPAGILQTNSISKT